MWAVLLGEGGGVVMMNLMQVEGVFAGQYLGGKGGFGVRKGVLTGFDPGINTRVGLVCILGLGVGLGKGWALVCLDWT